MKKISILLLVVLVLSACENDVSLPFNSEYFPLHVGDSWELVRPVGQKPTVPDLKREITKTVTINKREYYLMTSTYNSQGILSVDTTYYRIDHRGYVYALINNQHKESNPFRLAANDGASWSSTLYWLAEGDITLHQFTSTQLDQTAVDSCKIFSYDVKEIVDEESFTTLAPGLGIISQGNAWAPGYRLKKAVINGRTFEF